MDTHLKKATWQTIV